MIEGDRDFYIFIFRGREISYSARGSLVTFSSFFVLYSGNGDEGYIQNINLKMISSNKDTFSCWIKENIGLMMEGDRDFYIFIFRGREISY